MPLFDYSFNIDLLTLLVIIGLSVLLGFALRSRQLKKKKRQIAELEKDMMQAYAEILEIQKEYCDLESRIKDLAIPVISMKHTPKEEEKQKEEPPGKTGRRGNRPTRTA
jgi:cell division protein FtsL